MSAPGFPSPRVTPLRAGPRLRWGVLGLGQIAGDFVATLHRNTAQRVHAVAARSADRAERFARKHGVDRSYGDYGQLVADPDIDIVYIATVNSFHREHAQLAIAAGKHVLIEKPMGVDAADARSIVAAARHAGVFAMEAMWSRFLPQTDVLRQVLDDGMLGDVRIVTADFGVNFGEVGEGLDAPVFSADLAGGVLRDIGIYPVWFARFVLGAPTFVCARGSFTTNGVDDQAAILLSTVDGAQALLHTTMLADTPVEATISGSAGSIRVRSPFLMPNGFDLVTAAGRESWSDESGLRQREGLCWQAAAVAQHIADGLTESPLHPLDESVAVLETLDEARSHLR